jgi:hypothetical protein
LVEEELIILENFDKFSAQVWYNWKLLVAAVIFYPIFRLEACITALEPLIFQRLIVHIHYLQLVFLFPFANSLLLLQLWQ